ncbi:MAG: type III secretion system export apparatus subunit SctV [Deltaproteobacteria bacterium]|nr:type III secretion system export apparatus subunit SctV [Deltaproteobacteria bacterium]
MGERNRAPKAEGAALRRYGDIVLAVAVVAVVGMMILPLPTPLLDVLLATNISLSILLLLVTLYVPDALRIAAFPTILLVTTLFRLGLNVSTTRLILGQAYAGEVVGAFGDFVVGGNVAVGAVIFLVLTVIQFVVIAKGAERVAEVAARFTLDALPGKQMSVDADLRAGLVTADEARARRAALQRESQFYGAMDGAMKFVKGDAIAGIVITLVNIVAGLAIGTLQLGLTAGDALSTFATLTVGDGLVSQIPALLLSTAAGFVVTRVAAEDPGTHLGADIGAQIAGQPKAFLILSALLLGLALVPGLPFGPFVLLALFTGLAGWRLRLRERRKGAAARREADAAGEGPRPVAPAALEVSASLEPLVRAGTPAGEALRAALASVRDAATAATGVPIPAIELRMAPEPAAGTYRIRLYDVPFGTGRLPEDRVLALGSSATPEELGPPAEAAELAWTRRAGAWIPAERAEAARAAGCTVLEPPEVLREHLRAVLVRHAAQLLGHQEVQDLLDRLEEAAPALVRAATPKPLPLERLVALLKILAEEGVSIRDLRRVLESAVQHGAEKDPYLLAERVRADLKRAITATLTGGEPRIRVLLVAPEVEDVLRDAIRDLGDGPRMIIDPDTAEAVVRSAREAAAAWPPDGGPPVVLTQPELRRHLWRLLDLDLPDVRVVSYRELDPAVRIEPAGKIAVGRPATDAAAPPPG